MAMYVTDHLAWQQRIAHEEAVQRRYIYNNSSRKLLQTINSPVKASPENHSALYHSSVRYSTIQYSPGTSNPNSMRNKDFIQNARPNYYLIKSNEKGVQEMLEKKRKEEAEKPLKFLRPKHSCCIQKHKILDEADELKSVAEAYKEEPLRKSRYSDLEVPEIGYVGKSKSKPSSQKALLQNRRSPTRTMMRPDLRVRRSGVLKKRLSETFQVDLPKEKSANKSVIVHNNKEEVKHMTTFKQHLLKRAIVKELEQQIAQLHSNLGETELEGVKNFVKAVSEKDDNSLIESNLSKLEGVPENKVDADAKSRITAISKVSRNSAKSEALSKYVVSLESQLQNERQARQRIELQLTELQSMLKQLLQHSSTQHY